MAINQYDPNTGKKLKTGQTVQVGNTGNYVTQGTQFNSSPDLSLSSQLEKLGGAAGRFADLTPEQSARRSYVDERAMKAGVPLSLSGDYEASGFSTDFMSSYSSTPTNSITSTSTPTSNVINALNTLNPQNQKLDFTGTDPNDYLKDLAEFAITVPQEETDLQKQEKESDNILQEALKSMQDVPDTADIDRKLRNQLQIEQKQQVVSDLTGQLNAIVNKGQAQQLAQVGQGRGIPEAIIGGIQAQIGRETAIAALPVQAQLQAAQGNLEMANDSLDRLFKIYSDDATNRYNAKNKMFEVMYEVANKKEQRIFDQMKVENDREYEENKKDFDLKTQLVTTITQYGATASLISSVMDSPNYASALTLKGITKYMNDPLDRQLKNAQINKANAEAGQAKNLANVINLDPTSKTYTDQMIDASAGGRTMTQSEVLPITKGLTVVNQIGSLQETLKGQDTGPVLGILRDNNPYDVKAKLINAQLQALIPNLARGVYGEVGVLTNQDIDNYKQTLGNIKTTEDANNLLLAMTLSTIKSSLDNNFQTMAAAGRDVSGYKGIYSNLKTKLDTLNSNLGVKQISNTANSYLDSVLPQEAPAPSGPVSWLNTFFYGKK